MTSLPVQERAQVTSLPTQSVYMKSSDLRFDHCSTVSTTPRPDGSGRGVTYTLRFGLHASGSSFTVIFSLSSTNVGTLSRRMSTLSKASAKDSHKGGDIVTPLRDGR